MNSMFKECSSLVQLDVSHFNVNKVTDMRKMFESCTSLTELSLFNMKNKSVNIMVDMFNECSDVLKIKIKEKNKSLKKEAFGYYPEKKSCLIY